MFRAASGFDRHGVPHEGQFFKLADDLSVKSELVLTTAKAAAML